MAPAWTVEVKQQQMPLRGYTQPVSKVVEALHGQSRLWEETQSGQRCCRGAVDTLEYANDGENVCVV